MQCPQCGHKIDGRALFCPNCGHKLEQPQRASGNRSSSRRARSSDAGEQRRGCGLSLLVLGIAALVVLAIVGLGAAAFYYGMQDRAQVQQEAAEEHYDKGAAHLAQAEFELAIAEFELTLQLDPNHEQALADLNEARHRLEAKPTATPMLQHETKAAYLDELGAAFAQKDWPKVFEFADRLLALDPAYHRGEVDQMLFEAFYKSGLELIEGDRLKEAVRLFDRALALQPDNAQVTHAKRLATLYMTAMGYWGADWAKAVESLVALYRLAPDYSDVRQRTYEAQVSYGDFLVQQQNWCDAATQYAEALAIMDDAKTATKRQASLARCNQQPTPTAQTAQEGKETLTPEGTSAPPGTFVGRLVERTGIADKKMFIRGKVLQGGKGVSGQRVKIQAWDWSAIAVTDGNGQYSFDGLSNPVTYTLTLLDLPSLPVDVAGVWGKITWVNFQQLR